MRFPKKLTASGNVLVLLSLMYFITYVDRVNISTAAPAIKSEFGLSNTELGLIFSAFAYPYALFQVFGGWLGDKWGARLTLFLCSVIWAAATILTGFAGGFASLFMVRFMLGFGEGATFPTATRAMQNWVARDRRGFAQGFVHSAARLGNAITPPMVAALIVLVTWRGSFVLLGLVSLLWVVVWVWYFRDDPRQHRGVTEAELAKLPVQDATKAKPRVPWGRLTLRMLPVTITYFCYGWSFWLFITWLPSFFKDHYNLDLKNAALFSSAVFFAGVVGDTSGGIISDAILRRTGDPQSARRNVIVGAMVGAGICLGLVFTTANLTLDALFLASGFFCLELVIGPIWSIPMDIAPQYAGTGSGLMNTGSAVAAIVSPLAFGLIVDLTGSWVLPFAVSIALLLLGCAMAFTMHPERRFAEKTPGTATVGAE